MTTTPEQFLALLTGSQAERDAAPCVAPVAGHIGLMRNGKLTGALRFTGEPAWLSGDWPWRAEEGYAATAFTEWPGWNHEGNVYPDDECCRCDIIATLDLASVLAQLVKLRRAAAIDAISQWGQDHQGVDG